MQSRARWATTAPNWLTFRAAAAWDVELERRAGEVTAGSAETFTLDEYRAHVRQRRAIRATR